MDTQNSEHVIDISLSTDEMEAWVTISPPEEEVTVAVEDILDQLYAAGIKQGINEDALLAAIDSQQWGERISVAVGTPTAPGTSGGLALRVEDPFPQRVSTGQLIAEIQPPETGQPGETVTGHTLPADEGEPYVYSELPGLEPDSGNSDQIKAAIDGYLYVFGGEPEKVVSLWTFDIASGDMTCSMTMTRPPEPDMVTGEDLEKALADEGITTGIIPDIFQKTVEKEQFGDPVVVAEGKPAVPGENGRVEYLFETSTAPPKDAQGNVDHKAVQVRNVQKNDQLARLHEPTKGTTGQTIRGADIPATDGKPAKSPAGAGVLVSPEDQNLLLAGTDGRVILKSGGQISVDELYEVNDVDYSSGNIEFVGSLLIKGDIKAGFKVKARGDIIVLGIIEDAVVESGGCLQAAGIVGQGNADIRVERDIAINFCENQTLVAGGDVIVREALMHSNIRCKGRVELQESHGVIIGGNIIAVKGIKALQIGNDQEIKARLRVGMDPDVLDEIKQIDKALESLDENLQKVKKGLVLLQKMEALKPLSNAKYKLKTELEKAGEQLQNETKDLPARREELMKEMDKFREATVTVEKTIYPDNVITIIASQFVVTEALTGVRFTWRKGEVVAEAI
jgi:uncharacterized protein